jgi:hypothetical protein
MGSVFPDRKSPRLPAPPKGSRDRTTYDPMYVFWGDIDRRKVRDELEPAREDRDD